jgi:hypothetical protein
MMTRHVLQDGTGQALAHVGGRLTGNHISYQRCLRAQRDRTYQGWATRRSDYFARAFRVALLGGRPSFIFLAFAYGKRARREVELLYSPRLRPARPSVSPRTPRDVYQMCERRVVQYEYMILTFLRSLPIVSQYTLNSPTVPSGCDAHQSCEHISL